jgi:hypothetical protein
VGWCPILHKDEFIEHWKMLNDWMKLLLKKFQVSFSHDIFLKEERPNHTTVENGCPHGQSWGVEWLSKSVIGVNGAPVAKVVTINTTIHMKMLITKDNMLKKCCIHLHKSELRERMVQSSLTVLRSQFLGELKTMGMKFCLFKNSVNRAFERQLLIFCHFSNT